MNALTYDRRMAAVLWRRDVSLFLRQRSRVIGAIAPALLLWLALGAGIAPSFNGGSGDVGYVEYFFPGVILMLVLQVSISATMSVIEDRRQGFLQAVLVAPGARWALVVGKSLGAATVALMHAVLFMALLPLAGYPYGSVAWLSALGILALGALSLTGAGFALAWVLDSVQGYHVVMNLLLFPLWIVSGAMFPGAGLHPALAAVVQWNPMTYAVSGLRRALYGGALPAGTEVHAGGAGLEWLVLAATAALTLAIGCRVVTRRTDRG